MGGFSGHYGLLLTFAIALNVATVFSSTVMGGLMVEAGQAFGASGRITSLRQFVQSTSQIAAPLLGGYLAKVWFGWTTGIAAATVLALAVLTYLKLHEPPLAPVSRAAAQRPHYRPSPAVVLGLLGLAAAATGLYSIPDTRNVGVSLYALLGVFLLILGLIYLPTGNPTIVRAQGQLIGILKSRTLWIAAGMLFLVYTVPGFNTALVYQQSDVLKFDKSYIGLLAALEAGLGVLAAVAYGFFCRRINLRLLLVGGVGLNALTTLFYLVYTKQTAPLAHTFNGFCVILAEMALMDLSVRATPRGCEALGFSLMMSVRNFGIALSDVLGSKMMDQYHFSFNSLVLINAGTTFAILLFVPLLPRLIVSWRDGERPT
jgi:predicted MFS family arabinose efflux permease